MNRDRRLWAFPAACFLAAVVVVGLRLAWKEPVPQQALAQPPSPADLADRVRGLGLYLLAVSPAACYVSTEETTLEQIESRRLPGGDDQEDAWTGIVYVERLHDVDRSQGVGQTIGLWRMYGDPSLKRKILPILTALR